MVAGVPYEPAEKKEASPRTLFVHIGLPKTASTFLQHRVFRSLADRQVVLMPKNDLFRSEGSDRLLGQIFRYSDTIWKYRADDLLSRLFGPGWAEESRDILLSDEAIGREASRQGLFAAHLAGMRDALATRGIGRVKLLCFFRRQDHWLISHYVQVSDRRSRAGQADFQALVAEVIDLFSARFGFGALLDYASIHAACVSALSADDVVFCPMEWLKDRTEDVRIRLADFLELPFESLQLPGQQKENVRQAREGQWELRKPRSRFARAILNVTGGTNRVALDSATSRQLLDVYRSSNFELAERTGLDLQELGYFD